MRPVILLIDDEPDLLTVMSTALRHAMPQYEVLTTTSIEEAEALLADLDATGTQLALLVVDHVMGGRTGLELLEQARSTFPDVPTLMFTGQAAPTVEERARQVGARVLWKPMRLSALVGEVQELVAAPA